MQGDENGIPQVYRQFEKALINQTAILPNWETYPARCGVLECQDCARLRYLDL